MTRQLLQRTLRRLRDCEGVGLIETAIIAPLLLLLTFAIFDFSSIFYVYLALENGVSVASRYGVTGSQMDDPDNPGTQLSRVESVKLAMRQATPTLTLDDGDFSFSHLPPSGVAWLGGVGGPGDIDKVTVHYTWNVMTPLLRPFFDGGQINFTVESSMKNEPKFQ